MDIAFTVLLGVHIVLAAVIIGLVLLQHGKGADMGAAFGSGSSGSLFGATGSANFLSRTTAVLATFFFVTSIALTWIASHRGAGGGSSLMKGAAEAPASTAKPAETKAGGDADAGKAGTAGGAPAGNPAPAGGDVPK